MAKIKTILMDITGMISLTLPKIIKKIKKRFQSGSRKSFKQIDKSPYMKKDKETNGEI